MAKAIRFAVLGTGMVADYHRQALEANKDCGAELAAVGHHDPARFAEIGARFGVPCRTFDDLLQDRTVDAITLCTPSGQHAAQAIAAAQAGKHVLVEKPMALTLEDADAMIETCREAGVQLGVVLQRRAEPLFRRVHEAVNAGDLGDLTLGLVTIPYLRPQSYFEQADWRGTWAQDGGGVVMNQGIHLVDLLVWLMGDPVEVHAFGGTLKHTIEVEDTLAATLRFANGAVATLTATTTTSPGFAHRLELYGTQGGIQIEGENVATWQLSNPNQAKVTPFEVSRADGAGSGGDPRGIKPTGHIGIFKDFVTAIREDHPPRTDGAEGRRSLAAVLAIYQAAGLGPNAPPPHPTRTPGAHP